MIIFHSNNDKIKTVTHNFDYFPRKVANSIDFKKLKFLTKGSLALSTLAITACNNSGSKALETTACENLDNSDDFICVDTELSENPNFDPTNTISVSNVQVPIFGTETSDDFVASAAYLTSKTILDGGIGTD